MRKRCNRRHYQLVDPIRMAIEGARITDDERLDKLRMTELSAIEAFAKGKATVEDWRTLADMVNVSETFARMGIGPEVLEHAAALERHLADAYSRHGKTGRIGLTGPGLQAARDLYEFHDLQRSSVARSVLETAVKKTCDRIRSSHPDCKVFV